MPANIFYSFIIGHERNFNYNDCGRVGVVAAALVAAADDDDDNDGLWLIVGQLVDRSVGWLAGCLALVM